MAEAGERGTIIRHSGHYGGLFLLALVTRLNALWQGFITPDEPFWVFSSIRFIEALAAHRWADTFQIGHPGVTTMWVGTLGILWQRWRDAAGAAAHIEWVSHVPWIAPQNAQLFPHLVPFLPPARAAMAVLTSLGVVGVYALACKLWDRRLALIGAMLLALDPFAIALSGLLHVDALAATFMTLSLLAWLAALRCPFGCPFDKLRASACGTRSAGKPLDSRRPSALRASGYACGTRSACLLAALSGLCAGLGILSKSPAVFLVAAAGAGAILAGRLRSRQDLGRIALLGAIWAASMAAALFGAFPGMWEDPAGMVQRVYHLAGRYHDEPHEIAFFRGPSGGDPGSWFYPTAFLFRLTPITMVGAFLSLFFGLLFPIAPVESPTAPKINAEAQRRGETQRGATQRGSPDPAAPARQRGIAATMWLFVIGFTAFINLGAKKFDRYLLPTFPALNLLAAVGWVNAARWLGQGRPGRTRPFPSLLRANDTRHPGRTRPLPSFLRANALAIALLIGQGAMILAGWPYYLDVYNPLAGGVGAALRTLPVGWGEGLEKTAAYLNRQPNAAERVVAGASPVTLGPLFKGQVMMLDESSRLLADDVVITALDRQIDPQRVARLISGTSLAHTVHAGGQEMIWLYRVQDRAEADHLAHYGAPGDVVLCDASTPFARHPQEGVQASPGLARTVQQIVGAGEAQVVDLLNEWSTSHTRLWYFAYPNASPITASTIRHQLDTHAARLDEVDLGYAWATLYILPGSPSFVMRPSPFLPVDFGQVMVTGAALLPEKRGGRDALRGDALHRTETIRQAGGLEHGGRGGDEGVRADEGVSFLLRWQAAVHPRTESVDYAPFIHLLDQAGHLRIAGRGDDLLVDERFWPTSAWLLNDWPPCGTRTEVARDARQVEWPYRLDFPPGLPPGPYQVVVGLADARTGAWAPVLDAEGKIKGMTAPVLTVNVQPTERPPDPDSLQLPYPQNITWRNQLRLLGVDHPTRAAGGGTAIIGLGWLGLDIFNQDYAVRLSLRQAGDGQLALLRLDRQIQPAHEQTFPLSTYPTSRWRRGELIHELYDLVLPARLQDGDYTLSIQVLDQESIPLASPIEIGMIAISVVERSFELTRPPQHPLDLRLGRSISLLGYDLPQEEVGPGETLALTLYWRCESPVDDSFTVFVHLLDAEGQVQGQRDQLPMQGRAPTSGWVNGQIVTDEYAIPVSDHAQPGPHRIEVGMYRAQDVVRLPMFDSAGNRLPDDRVLLEPEINIAR